MVVKRKKRSPSVKFEVYLAAMKGDKTISQIAKEYGVHSSRIHAWKKQLREEGPEVFERKSAAQQQLRHEHPNQVAGGRGSKTDP